MADIDLLLGEDLTLSFDIRVDEVPPTGREVAFELPEEMRTSMAERFGVRDIEGLAVHARIMPLDEGCVHVTGAVRGRVEQVCGVTLDPMWTQISQDFAAEFQPVNMVAKFVIPEDDFETDLPESLTDDGAANIGELAMQVFAMEIPAYPRKEGAAFYAGDLALEQPVSPFAVLADLHKPTPGDEGT